VADNPSKVTPLATLHRRLTASSATPARLEPVPRQNPKSVSFVLGSAAKYLSTLPLRRGLWTTTSVVRKNGGEWCRTPREGVDSQEWFPLLRSGGPIVAVVQATESRPAENATASD